MINEFVKDRIIEIHGTKNISARALSLELGRSSEYVNQVENGRINPPLDFLWDFCDYFGITLSEFFDKNYTYPIETQELLSEIKKLSREELSQILEIVKTINKNKDLN